jgi:hypothetical protein
MKEQQQLDIHLSEETAQGVYSNLAIITHSNAEFILDFVAMMPGLPKANVRSRIVMTPQNAKRFLNALAENIKKFEDHNGLIKESAIEIPIVGNGASA